MVNLVMKIIIRLVLIFILILVIVPLLLFRYFFASGPRDLGVRFSKVELESATKKDGVEAVAITPTSPSIKDSLRFEGKNEVNTTFTGAEVSALVSYQRWKYRISDNVQLKIHPDGSAEMSGILNIKNILPYISLTHSTAEVESAIQKYNIGFNPPYYLKGKLSIINNQVTLTPETIQLGKITLPQDLISKNLSSITSFIETRIKSVPNLDIRSLKLENGIAKIDATVPAKQYTVWD